MRRLRLSAVVLAGLLGPLARAHARSAPPNPYPGYMSTTYRIPLGIPEKTREHFRQAIEADPKGNFGRLARGGS